MAFTVTVSRQVTDEAGDASNTATVRLVMTVTGFTDLQDGGVFVYAVDPVTQVERYDHIAVPTDLQNYNLNAASGLSFVRRTSIDLYYASYDLVEAGISTIESSIQDLMDDLASAEALGTAVSTTFTGTA